MPSTTKSTRYVPPRKTLRRRVYDSIHSAIHVHGDSRERITDAVMKVVNAKLRALRKRISDLERRPIRSARAL